MTLLLPVGLTVVRRFLHPLLLRQLLLLLGRCRLLYLPSLQLVALQGLLRNLFVLLLDLGRGLLLLPLPLLPRLGLLLLIAPLQRLLRLLLGLALGHLLLIRHVRRLLVRLSLGLLLLLLLLLGLLLLHSPGHLLLILQPRLLFLLLAPRHLLRLLLRPRRLLLLRRFLLRGLALLRLALLVLLLLARRRLLLRVLLCLVRNRLRLRLLLCLLLECLLLCLGRLLLALLLPISGGGRLGLVRLELLLLRLLLRLLPLLLHLPPALVQQPAALERRHLIVQHAPQQLVEGRVVGGQHLLARLRGEPVAVGQVVALRGVDGVVVQLDGKVLRPVGPPVALGAGEARPLSVAQLVPLVEIHHRAAHDARCQVLGRVLLLVAQLESLAA